MNPNVKTIKLDKPLTVEYAVQNREFFDTLLYENPGFVLDISDVPKLDITGIQLIIAVYQEITRQHKIFDITGSFNAAISKELAICGVTPQNWISWKEFFFERNFSIASKEPVHE